LLDGASSSCTAQAVPVLVRAQDPFQGSRQLEERRFHIGDLPTCKGRLDFFPAHARINGRMRRGQHSNITVASSVARASTLRAIPCCCSVSKSWKVPVSRMSQKSGPLQHLKTGDCGLQRWDASRASSEIRASETESYRDQSWLVLC
jgi:hypothetical protein